MLGQAPSEYQEGDKDGKEAELRGEFWLFPRFCKNILDFPSSKICSLAGKKALVVDDEPDVRKVLALLLKQQG